MKEIKIIDVLAFLLFLAVITAGSWACNAPLNSSGKRWKSSDIKHRMFARKTCHCKYYTTAIVYPYATQYNFDSIGLPLIEQWTLMNPRYVWPEKYP